MNLVKYSEIPNPGLRVRTGVVPPKLMREATKEENQFKKIKEGKMTEI